MDNSTCPGSASSRETPAPFSSFFKTCLFFLSSSWICSSSGIGRRIWPIMGSPRANTFVWTPPRPSSCWKSEWGAFPPPSCFSSSFHPCEQRSRPWVDGGSSNRKIPFYPMDPNPRLSKFNGLAAGLSFYWLLKQSFPRPTRKCRCKDELPAPKSFQMCRAAGRRGCPKFFSVWEAFGQCHERFLVVKWSGSWIMLL